MRVYFNDDLTNKGIEGWYEIINKKLVVYLKATNCREDWRSNFTALPKYSIFAHCCVHQGYYYYANWAADFITKISIDNNIAEKNIILFGYSMGGGIAQIVGADMINIKIISIDGPRTTGAVFDNMKLIFNRGSLVHSLPFWFKRIKSFEVLNKKLRPFWKAHADYSIEEIIKKEVLE